MRDMTPLPIDRRLVDVRLGDVNDQANVIPRSGQRGSIFRAIHNAVMEVT